ncbi:Glucocorticoid receptor [Saguinus oedipus]|uniref:Glucocorticoid receptor n=1 Tax=Saguinus oedipus TaxID=9490 RepID=A0ABQ9W535_SAGOE|nr:Glucocorticoid receptor [Saguinus oedipus]
MGPLSWESPARKTKKKIKGIQQATTGVSQETSENPANKTIVPATLPQLTPTLVSLLEVIEPEVLYAGYDSTVPDSTWRIMTTLNMLGGRQVIAAVKWAKAIPVPKDGLKSQELFDEIRMTYIKELGKAIVKREGNSSQNWQRFYQLTKLLDSMHEVVENLLNYCFQTFLDKTMSIEFPEMLAEIITNQLPKYSNGNIRKLLFHQK